MMAEMNGELAFTASKANTLDAEWLGYHSGPSLPILAKHLDKAIETNFLPYESFLSQYISEEEIALRYANAKKWYQEKATSGSVMAPPCILRKPIRSRKWYT